MPVHANINLGTCLWKLATFGYLRAPLCQAIVVLALAASLTFRFPFALTGGEQ